MRNVFFAGFFKLAMNYCLNFYISIIVIVTKGKVGILDLK